MLHSHSISSQLSSYTQAVLTVKMSTHYPPIFQILQILQKSAQMLPLQWGYSRWTHSFWFFPKVLLEALLSDSHWFKPVVLCSNLSYDGYNDVLITLVILSSPSVYASLEDKNHIFWSSSFVFLTSIQEKLSMPGYVCLVKIPLRSVRNCGGPWIRLRGLILVWAHM